MGVADRISCLPPTPSHFPATTIRKTKNVGLLRITAFTGLKPWIVENNYSTLVSQTSLLNKLKIPAGSDSFRNKYLLIFFSNEKTNKQTNKKKPRTN